MLNKKGSIFFGVIIGIFIFVCGVLFLPFLADDISTTRTDLKCSEAVNITGGVMITCLSVDILIPYVILFFSSLALGFIIGGGN